MPFIHDDFLLHSDEARRLYHEFAANEPILDYHTHLPPEDVAANRQFANLYEIWLEGDHYKWRAMRANGIDEVYITGNADPYDKYTAWCSTVPHTLRNPLYHWTHLELKRYFDIDTLLSPDTAKEVWDEAERRLATPELSAHGILKQFRLKAVCTTDDPADDLPHHQTIAGLGIDTKIFPTFRPDKAMTVHQPESWNAWVDRLATRCNTSINSLDDLLGAMRQRHDEFGQLGCRLSDHGMAKCFGARCDKATATRIFNEVRGGKAATEEDFDLFGSFLMIFFGQLDAEKGWTKQMHIGVIRNNCSRLFAELGPDTGFDSMCDIPQGLAMQSMLDQMDQAGGLPQTIVYNLNPSDNYLFATMVGNFQGGSPGKMQFGSGWWFLDQKEAMEWQINALSNLGLLSRFVGMLTDSRSFMSYPRHEYFRRTLCNLLGTDMARGELPNDMATIGDLVRRICYSNAREYLGLDVT